MSCVECMTSFVETMKSVLVLFVAAIYRVITFMIFLSASIGPSVLVSRLYNNISGLDPMPDIVESSICMMLVSLWAEFSVGFEKRICGDLMRDYKNRYPNTMSFGRFAVHFVFYMVAYCQLYIQFEAVHTIPASSSKRGNYESSQSEKLFLDDTNMANPVDDEREAEAVKNQEIHTSMFLLAFAYLIFVTSRAFHKDLLNAVGNLPVASFSILSNCMLRIGFAILHGVVNVFYFLPCIAIAFTARGYKTPGNTTYFQLTFTAGLSGMVGALFELNRPWPQRRGRIPCLFYENNLIGKNLLGHALIVSTLVGYYRPFRNPKVVETKFDSTNNDVVYFSLSVAYAVLHIVKVAAHGVLTQAHDFDVQRMDQGVIDLDIPNALFEVFDDHANHQGGGGRSSGGGAAAAGDSSGGDGEMCARCAANALNNNACASHPQQPPELTNNNNNNEARTRGAPLKKQADDVQNTQTVEDPPERTELTVILEEGEKMLAMDLKEELLSRIARKKNMAQDEDKRDGTDKDEIKQVISGKPDEQKQNEECEPCSSTTEKNPRVSTE